MGSKSKRKKPDPPPTAGPFAVVQWDPTASVFRITVWSPSSAKQPRHRVVVGTKEEVPKMLKELGVAVANANVLPPRGKVRAI